MKMAAVPFLFQATEFLLSLALQIKHRGKDHTTVIEQVLAFSC